MYYKITFLSLALLGLMNCTNQKNINSENNSATEIVSEESGNITFQQGESKILKESGIKITFKSVSQDSRCPEGVQCIWAGVAVADLELSGTSKKPMLISLATQNFPAQKLSKTAVFDGYKIELQNVLPYPKQNAEKENYSIEISAYKLADNQDETTN